MDLIERTAHMAQLGTFLAEARAGAGRVVLLGGDAGVGKTSLTREFVRRDAAGLRVLWGSGEPLVTPEALGPFQEMPPLARILASHPGRVDLLRALLDELGATPTTLMVVEDAHWADDATLDALRFLGRRVHATHGLLLITYREDEGHGGSPLRAVLGDLATAPGCRRVHLDPLSLEAVSQLAEGHAVEPSRLHAATGGNPFYVTEVLAAAGWTVPPTVSDAVLARASRLDPAARTVLEVVSLAPGGLESKVAVKLSGGDAGALDSCVERGMLEGGSERVTFRHELARLAVEGSVPRSRRRRLHLELLEQLEQLEGADPARLAHHADAAGDGAAVLRYAPLAARAASRRGAHRAAAEHFGRAVAKAESLAPTPLADLVSAWADERTIFDDPREVLALRQRTVQLRREAGDRLGEGRELLELARMQGRLHGVDADDPHARQATRILEELPAGPELAQAYARSAYGAMSSDRLDEAMHLAARAIELADIVGAASAAIGALRVRATVATIRGRPTEAAAANERARDLALDIGDHESVVTIMNDTGLEFLMARRYPEARVRFEAAVELGRAVDLDFRVSYAEACLCEIDFAQGRWADAERLADRLLAEHQRQPQTRLSALVVRGRLQVRRGVPAGVQTLEEALAINERGEAGEPWDVAAGLAEAAWLSGHPADIPSIIGDLYESARLDWTRWPAGELAFWLWRAGSPTQPPSDVAEPYALQMAGDWRRAAAAWQDIGSPYERADALSGGEEPAMREALEIFSRLGAEPAADRLRDRMRRAGISRIPARPRRSTRAAPGELTRRQLEIVELLEGGLTDREIAARLFITEKTAGHHVSAILAKLGARSRTEAASTARKMGIVAS